jgi:hypothetical protein
VAKAVSPSRRARIVPLEEKEHRDLDVSRLRDDMLALWREEGAAASTRGPVTRACLSTLVVPAVSAEDGDTFLTDLLPLLPSRAILVRSEPERPSGSVESWVGGSCFRRADGGSLVCSEVVHMTAGPDSEHRVASALRSLRVGGVPMFLVSPWTSPLVIPWRDRVTDVVDAVLGDTAALSEHDARALWRRCVDCKDVRWGDVQWECLEDWRRAVASWFDRPQEKPLLDSITEVVIEAADTAGGEHKALLLAGWLGSRLGWRAAAGGGRGRLRFIMQSGTSAVPVEIRLVDAGKDPSLVRSVTLSFSGGREPVRWHRVPDGALVVDAGGRRRFRLNRAKTTYAVAVLAFLRRHEVDPVATGAMRLAEPLGTTG